MSFETGSAFESENKLKFEKTLLMISAQNLIFF